MSTQDLTHVSSGSCQPKIQRVLCDPSLPPEGNDPPEDILDPDADPEGFADWSLNLSRRDGGGGGGGPLPPIFNPGGPVNPPPTPINPDITGGGGTDGGGAD